MKLSREPILELMGRSHGLHSCVLTTYSFDPLYFDVKILRTLFGAGIRNVVVLVDAGMYARALEEAPRDLRHSGAYGLHPVFMNAAYHPKMIFAVGHKEGFLAVGSGNLTAGGHGGNDEIWGAFHVNGARSPHAPLFAKAWATLREQTKGAAGSVRERLDWIVEHGPWLVDLKGLETDAVEWRGQTIQLVTGPTDGLTSMMEDKVGARPVQRITVVSPYFDAQGTLLARWHKLWPNARIDVVVEDRLGTLPLELSDKVISDIAWYPWRLTPLAQEDERTANNRRLHAKAVVVELERGGDVGYLGSANHSVAAWGTDRFGPVNAEAGLLIERPSGGLLEMMGLDSATWKPTAWAELQDGFTAEADEEEQAETWAIPMLLVEQDGDELTLHIQLDYGQACTVEVHDKHGVPVFQQALDRLPRTCTLKVVDDLAEGLCMVRDRNGKAMSNTLVVQNAQAHRGCNPDKQQAKLNEVISLMGSGQVDQLENLLKYAVFEMDGEEKQMVMRDRRPGGIWASEDSGMRMDTYEAFTNVSPEVMARQKGLLHHANVRIADILAGLSAGMEQTTEVSDELRDVEVDLDEETGREDSIPSVKTRTVEAQQVERSAVQRYLKKYAAHISELAENVLDGEVEHPLTLPEQSRFLIASWLVLLYSGRRFKDTNGQDLNELYLTLQGRHAWDNIRSFSELVLLDYLVVCDKARTPYSVASVERKMQAFTKEAMVRSLLMICAQPWGELEYVRFDMLALNVLFRMEKMGLTLDPGTIKSCLAHYDADQFIRSKNYGYQVDRIIKILAPAVSRLTCMRMEEKKAIAEPASSLRKGALVFSSRFGFGIVDRTMRLGSDVYEVAYRCPGDLDAVKVFKIKSAIRIHLDPATTKGLGQYRSRFRKTRG